MSALVTGGNSRIAPQRPDLECFAHADTLRPFGRLHKEPVAHPSVDAVDDVPILFEQDARPPVNRHVGTVILLNGFQQQLFVPAATLFGSAVVLVFENDGKGGPEQLGHLAVVPRPWRRLDQNAVVTDRDTFREGIVCNRKTSSGLVMTGEVIRNAKLRILEVFQVEDR